MKLMKWEENIYIILKNIQRQIIMTISGKDEKNLCSDLNKEEYNSDMRNEDAMFFFINAFFVC